MEDKGQDFHDEILDSTTSSLDNVDENLRKNVLLDIEDDEKKIQTIQKEVNEDHDVRILEKISNSVNEKIKTSLNWMKGEEGKILTRGISVISPFIVGEPIGFFLPFILQSANVIIRKRLLKHIPDLANKLQENKEKLHLEFIQGEIGQKLLRDTIQQIIHETNEEKINHLKSFLINAYSDDGDKEVILSCQKAFLNMEPIHIKLLSIIKNPKEILREVAEKRKKEPRKLDEMRYGKLDYVLYWEPLASDDDINKFYLHADPILYQNGLKDLVTWNILETVFYKKWLYFDHTFDGNFESMINEVDRYTTVFGKRLLNFIYGN